MDLTFKTENGVFNYRVGAVILNNNKILTMRDERSLYCYLPGGRVGMGETAESAIIREIKEELNITPEIIRPLWLNQGFFTEEIDALKYHEICIYFLIDISKTPLLENGERFTLYEGKHTHEFEWLDISTLKEKYLYPIFIKDRVNSLPEHLEILTEYE